MNDQNLVPFTSDQSRELAAINGRKGGIAAGKARRERKTLRESFKIALSCAIPKKSPLFKSLKKKKDALGMEGDPTVQDIMILGMVMKSSKDTNASAFIRDTIGEKPTETIEDVTPHSPFELGLIPLDLVEKGQREHEERQKQK